MEVELTASGRGVKIPPTLGWSLKVRGALGAPSLRTRGVGAPSVRQPGLGPIKGLAIWKHLVEAPEQVEQACPHSRASPAVLI